MLNLIIFGPPGAGKGTHSVRLMDKYYLDHISTGDILRNEIRGKTKLGAKAKNYIDKGELVPDELVLQMLFHELEKHTETKGFIFDGFPRTIMQAEKFDEMLNSYNMPISLVISLEVNFEELIKRLLKRGIESGRTDDTEDIIKQRLNIYNCQTKPLLKYYNKKNILKSIPGIGSIEEIYGNICKVIEENVKF